MRSVIFAVAAATTIVGSSAHAQPAGPPDPAGPPPDMPINTTPEPAPAPPASEPAPAPADAAPAPAPAPPPPPPAADEPPPADQPSTDVPLPPAPATPAFASSPNKDAAWLFVGGALTFLTAGTVLAYSTSSAEQDIRDLYTSPSGGPVVFDDATKKRYDELAAEGRRYEVLSWTAFGIAGGCAIGAAIFFVRASHETEPTITPVLSPTGAGVRVRF